jgi:hypothetical protein
MPSLDLKRLHRKAPALDEPTVGPTLPLCPPFQFRAYCGNRAANRGVQTLSAIDPKRAQRGVRVHNKGFTTINKGNNNGEGSDDTDN